jgi:hypothetical protein
MTKGNEEWVDWRPTKRSVEAMVEMTIRGIAREPERNPAAGAAGSKGRR